MKKNTKLLLGILFLIIILALFLVVCLIYFREEIPKYTVGGTVTGLKGTLLLQCNGADDTTITSDSAFTFSTAIKNGTAYSVKVLSHTMSGTQGCTVKAGSGTLSGTNVTNVQVACNDYYFFPANDGINGTELWKSDGTAAGTAIVKDINKRGGSLPKELTNVDGTLFFTASDGTNGTELWKSDGTEADTVMVKDINERSSFPHGLTNMKGTLFFTAKDSRSGNELWKSDGTEAGTIMVKDINTSGHSYPEMSGSTNYYLTNVNGTLFFRASDGINGTELWKSDGTEAGTVMVKDIHKGMVNDTNTSGHSSPMHLTNVNGTLFFRASDGINGTELWKSDGTEAGTIMVKDINTRSSYADSYPRGLTNVNGTLFFKAYDGINGTVLMKSDGTPSGTIKVKDINIGHHQGQGH
jgi:ELWxxDGT repeat protein